MIDYSAIREWAAVPFRPKGQGIILDEETEKLEKESGISADYEGRKADGQRKAAGTGVQWERDGQTSEGGAGHVAQLSSATDDIDSAFSVGAPNDYVARENGSQEPIAPGTDVGTANPSDCNLDSSDSDSSIPSRLNSPTVTLVSSPLPLDSFADNCEQAHNAVTTCEDEGPALMSLPPSFSLSPRVLDLSDDPSSSPPSSFKAVPVSQSVIHSPANAALINLRDDDADILMQRHHVLISSGRSTPSLSALECQIIQPIAVDPMSESVLRYLSGRFVGMEGWLEDKNDFDNDADLDGERDKDREGGLDDCQQRPPSLPLFNSMEDLSAIHAVDGFFDAPAQGMYDEDLYVRDGSVRYRGSNVGERRGYSL